MAFTWLLKRYSYGPLLVVSTYNPIYRMYNPIYDQLKLIAIAITVQTNLAIWRGHREITQDVT